MNKFNHTIQGVVLSGAVLALAGRGMGDSGPSSHTVKHLVADSLYTNIVQMGTLNMQGEAPMFPSEAPSPVYLKHKAELKKVEAHKAHYLHKLESRMHEKGCTKAGDATYNCSVVLDNPKNHQKRTLIITIGKAGHVWSLAGIKRV